MSKAIVKRDHLKYNNKDYFRCGAENLNVGVLGEKKLEPFQSKLFNWHWKDKQDRVTAYQRLKLNNVVLDGTQMAVVEIDETQSEKGSVQANVNVKAVALPVKGQVGGNASKDHTTTANLKLVKMVLGLDDVAKALNADHDALTTMLKAGGLGRVVHEVWIVMEATLAESIETGKGATLDVGATPPNAPVTVSVDVKGQDNKSIKNKTTMGEGQIFAYSTLKFKEKYLEHYWSRNKVTKGWDKLDQESLKKPVAVAVNDLDEDGYGKGK